MNTSKSMNLGAALVLGAIMFLLDLCGFIPLLHLVAIIAGFAILKLYGFINRVRAPISIRTFIFKAIWPTSIFPSLTLALIRMYRRSAIDDAAAATRSGPGAIAGSGAIVGTGLRVTGTRVRQGSRVTAAGIRGASAAVGGAVSLIPFVGAPIGMVVSGTGKVAAQATETAGLVADKSLKVAGTVTKKISKKIQTVTDKVGNVKREP